MGIGSSIALLAVGAILAFAVDFQIGGVNFTVVGYILMACGLLGLLFTALIYGRRDRTVIRERPRDRDVIRERDIR
ncbi:MAG TPA: DUF6458 family protein [Euzebyales bacterium]|jgi:Domain of unknown function (DUF6458)|nr:DUF6458 family protein [Euzebyales bacterium]